MLPSTTSLGPPTITLPWGLLWLLKALVRGLFFLSIYPIQPSRRNRFKGKNFQHRRGLNFQIINIVKTLWLPRPLYLQIHIAKSHTLYIVTVISISSGSVITITPLNGFAIPDWNLYPLLYFFLLRLVKRTQSLFGSLWRKMNPILDRGVA